jgi:hypothetical protein
MHIENWSGREERRALTPAGIAEQNTLLLHRYREFRRAADAVVAAWRERAEVMAVALIGSVAVVPWKEVPRFAPYRRARIALWHECKDLDMAVWLLHLGDLDGLRRAKDRALREHREQDGAGVASHQVDVFVLEPGTERYLGRLCQFSRCPKGKLECLVPGCGSVAFLQQHEASVGSRDPWSEAVWCACSIAKPAGSAVPSTSRFRSTEAMAISGKRNDGPFARTGSRPGPDSGPRVGEASGGERELARPARGRQIRGTKETSSIDRGTPEHLRPRSRWLTKRARRA